MIKADAISRQYGDFLAVNQVSFQIGPNDIVGLLGQNGAGKTTIMKMITGYLEPTAGKLTVAGINVADNRSAVQQHIGYLPENCPLYPDMTVIDYLEYTATLKALSKELVNGRIIYALRKTSLAEVARRPVNTLSRGYRQRLGVAQAILHSPKLLILDEPTNGLDPSQILEMRSLIKELAAHATVVVSTHILQEVQAVCRRVLIINKGRLALDENMSKLQSSGRLLLTTDAEPQRLSNLLSDIPMVAVSQADKLDQAHRYTLDLGGQDAAIVAARVAKTIVDGGANLYAMHPVVRDLETIFAEISAGAAADADAGAAASATPVNALVAQQTAALAQGTGSNRGATS